MRRDSFPRANSEVQKTRPGFILVVVLAVLTFVTLVCYRYADQMALEREAASLAVREAQARLWAKSGVEVAMAMMAAPEFDVTSVYDDIALFAQQGVKSTDGSGPVGAFSIVVGEDIVTGQPLRYGFDSEGGKINLNALVLSELSEEDQREILIAIPNMTETLADTILDYLDSDAQARDFGTETDEEGYLIRNGPLSSLDDLLNIPGMTRDLLYGEDVNRNRVLDINEDDGDLRWPTDNGDGALSYGFDHYLTLWSAESNLRSDGTAKINLNTDDLTQLETDLASVFSADVVKYIIAYRLYGPVQTAAAQGGTDGGTGMGGSGGSGSGGSSGGGSSSGGSGRGGSSSGGSSSGGGRGGSSSGGGGSSGGGSNSGGVGTSTAQSGGGGGTTTNSTSTGSGSGGTGGGGGGGSSSGVNTVTGSSSTSGVNVINSRDVSGQSQTTASSGSSNSTNSSGTTDPLDTTQQPKFQIASIYELFESSVKYTENEAEVTLTSPWVSTDLSVLEDIDTTLSLTDEASLAGRIDLNYATREVLTGLPDITTAMVDGILAKQGDWRYSGELMGEGVVNVEQMRMLDQFITTGSKTFRLQSIGYPEKGTQSVRVEAIIDASSGKPSLIWMRDLSMLGKAYEDVVIKPETVDTGTTSPLSN